MIPAGACLFLVRRVMLQVGLLRLAPADGKNDNLLTGSVVGGVYWV